MKAPLAVLLVPAALSAQMQMPLKNDPKPTTVAITAADLRTRLYIFADDSMQGRETGTIGEVKATTYIAGELKKLGLRPAGDSGGYLQYLPLLRRAIDTNSTLVVDGKVLRFGVDFIVTTRGNLPEFRNVPVVVGPTMPDTLRTLNADDFRGRVVIVNSVPMQFGAIQALQRNTTYQANTRALQEAVAIVAVRDSLTGLPTRTLTEPRPGDVMMRPTTPAAVGLTLSRQTAMLLFGSDPASLPPGTPGKALTANIVYRDTPVAGRNVVAVLPGADPALRNTYVAIGAHLDHVGYLNGRPVDHDSLHLRNQARFAIVGMVARGQQQTPEQRAAVDAIKINLDSVRGARPSRADSIRNGADDDGSGSVTLLEIAEAFARSSAKPKRSIVFVWHTGEEKGLWGSRWYVDHPTVTRDSIVAQLNMDMVGRGEASDLPVGAPNYLQLVGSRRLSTELGDLVEAVNKTEKMPFTFDYTFDANGHPENIYCRSDHFHYARWGIPVTFFTTGLHGDYHQISDEPQYIAYDHMARVGQLVHDVAVRVANANKRPVVDGVKMDPTGVCRQ